MPKQRFFCGTLAMMVLMVLSSIASRGTLSEEVARDADIVNLETRKRDIKSALHKAIGLLKNQSRMSKDEFNWQMDTAIADLRVANQLDPAAAFSEFLKNAKEATDEDQTWFAVVAGQFKRFSGPEMLKALVPRMQSESSDVPTDPQIVAWAETLVRGDEHCLFEFHAYIDGASAEDRDRVMNFLMERYPLSAANLALRVFRRDERWSSAEQLMLAKNLRIVDNCFWQQRNRAALEASGTTEAAISGLQQLASSKLWVVRLYVASVMHQGKDLLDENLVSTMCSDEHNYVRRFVNAKFVTR